MRVLGADDRGQHRLERGEHALVVLVGHHADHADQRAERERVLERVDDGRGAVRVVRGVEHDRRAAPDDLEPARRGDLARTPRGPARRRAGPRRQERLDRGQRERGVLRLVGAVAAAGTPRRTRRAGPAAATIWPPTAGTRCDDPEVQALAQHASRRPRRPARRSPRRRPRPARRRRRCEPGLMIPAFSRAIVDRARRRGTARGRRAIGRITATVASATLVASQEPPMPTSTTATSTGASANAAYAIADDRLEERQRVVGVLRRRGRA